ncbi:MAG: hypothetical protein OEW84_08675, partial [Aigarchaeota archaeon]|nr:hypothetical protein [Aigarchaeota archaeon]
QHDRAETHSLSRKEHLHHGGPGYIGQVLDEVRPPRSIEAYSKGLGRLKYGAKVCLRLAVIL